MKIQNVSTQNKTNVHNADSTNNYSDGTNFTGKISV